MRDRLIELITNADTYDSYACKLCTDDDSCELCYAKKLADHLLANGVIVPPCKVGNTVYEIDADNPFEEELRVIESKVEGFYIGTSRNLHSTNCKTVFLTKEDAERALKEREHNDR